MTTKISFSFALLMTAMVHGFSIPRLNLAIRPSSSTTTTTTALKLQDWVADLIDGEVHRQGHKKEYEQEWMDKNKGAILHSLNKDKNNDFLAENTMLDANKDFRQKAKDRKMAKDDPQQYCADRCVATGNCDVFEDIYKFTPEEVMEFCTDCVLSEDEEECPFPEQYYALEDLENLKP